MSKRVRHIPVGSGKGFHPLQSLRAEAEHVFERLADGFRHLRGEQHRPPADASESGEGYHISFELPGMEFDDIDVVVDDDVLAVYGEMRDEREERERNYYLLERTYGTFSRSFQLPEDADKQRIDARLEKGVLEIFIPRLPGSDKDLRKFEIISP